MCSEYSIDQNQNSDFRRRFFLRNFIKNVMTFFKEFIDHETNNVIFVRIKKIDDKIHNNILSIFINHDNKNQ